MDGTCQFQVLWGLELFGGSVVAELHNLGSRQSVKSSCASRVAQSYRLRKQSCATRIAQSGEVAESDFIPM